MVAQERHVAQDNRFLIIRVGNFIDELLLALTFLNPALEFGLEWREHPPDEIFHRHASNLILHLHKLVVHFRYLCASAMNRHLQCLHFHDIPEPFRIKILLRVHINPDNQRAGKFAFKTIYLLACEPHLHTEIIDIHLVIHLLHADGDNFHHRHLGRVRSLDAEFRWNIYSLANLVRICDSRVVENLGLVFLDKGLHSVNALDFLQLCLESHRASVAFD